MTIGEYSGHAVSAAVLVVGGMYAKSALLNWIVGPLTVVVFVSVANRAERLFKAGSRRQ